MPDSQFQITVKRLDGFVFNIEVKPEDKIQTLKQKINTTAGIPMNQQRLIFNGKQLENGQTVDSYKINKQAIVMLVLQLRSIGVFDYHINSHSRHMLSSQKYEPENLEIKNLVKDLHGEQDAEFYVYQINQDTSCLQKIRKFADQKYQELEKLKLQKQDIQDLKINISRIQLINLGGWGLVSQLEALFVQDYQEIVIRRCQSHGKLINFHTDFSRKTLQLSLNDDSQYVGGRLMYASKGQLFTPERKIGTVTIHDNKIVHGVTVFRSGVRYGLFFLKKE